MSDEMRDWAGEHEHGHPDPDAGTVPNEPAEPAHDHETEASPGGARSPESAAQGELADELRSIRAVGEDRR